MSADRFAGCLLGGALGGAPIPMTLFTAEGLIRAEQRSRDRGFCDPVAVVANAYQRCRYTRTGEWTAFGERGWLADELRLRAPAHGDIAALLHIAPVGLIARSRELALELGNAIAGITGADPAAGTMAAIIHDLAHGLPLPDEVTVGGALQLAVECARAAERSSDGVSRALLRCGDRETATLTGQLLGTLVGAAGLPTAAIALRDVIERLARDLATITSGGRLRYEDYPPH
jgi:hypothetical protein